MKDGVVKNMKTFWNKNLRLLLVFVLVVSPFTSMFSFPQKANAESSDFAGGSGTADDPYVIINAEQLDNVRNHLDKHFILGGDIDLSEWGGWTPLGVCIDDASTAGCAKEAEGVFHGTFDGQGYEIQNMTISEAYSEGAVGLFAAINGVVKNIGVTNIEIHTNKSYVGGLAGVLFGTVENAYTTGTINSTKGHVGGLFGYVHYDDGLMKSSWSAVNVTGERHVGGIVGENLGIVSDVYATGDVKATYNDDVKTYVGGLIGLMGGNAIRSYAIGNVIGNDTDYTAALIGRLTGGWPDYSEMVINSYWNTETSGQDLGVNAWNTDEDFAEAKTTAELQRQSTYDTWDFEHTWAIIDGETYPRLIADFSANELSNVMIEHSDATVTWDTPFDSNKRSYTVTLDKFVDEVDVTAAPAEPNSTVLINGIQSDGTVSLPVHPGENTLSLQNFTDATEFVGQYEVTIHVPVPEITDLSVTDAGYYGIDDRLTITVAYETDVEVEGKPELPFLIGESHYKAIYRGKGEANELLFDYDIEEGIVDTDGIEIGEQMELPSEANITVAGVTASLALPDLTFNDILIDGVAPTVTLSQDPDKDTLTNQSVTITPKTNETGSGIVETKWDKGSFSADYFTTNGQTLTDDKIVVTTNDTYTVYVVDKAGNEGIETINIQNIISKLPKINWSAQPTSPTNKSVTISVTAEVYDEKAGNSLTHLHWMEGNQEVGDFSNGAKGNDILTDKAFQVSSNGIYTLYAKDAAGNESNKAFEITNIDWEAPVISLQGDLVMTITEGDVFTDPGATASDNMDEEISSKIIVAGEVDTETPGEYMLTYNVTDRAGNAAEAVTRRVIVERRPSSSNDRDDDDETEDDNDDSSSTPNRIRITPTNGGSLSVDGAKIVIPSGAVNGNVTIEVERLSSIKEDLQPDFADIITDVFEFTKGDDNTFTQPVTITLSFDLDDVDQQSQHVSIFWLNEETGEWEELDNVQVDLENEVVRGEVDHFTKFAVLATENYEESYIHGFPDGTFKPNQSVSRVHMAIMLAQLTGYDGEQATSQPFKDIDLSNPYADRIAFLKAQGIINGDENGNFRPNDTVTRGQMAAIVANIKHLDVQEMDSLSFSDTEDNWAKWVIEASVKAGIMEGYSDETFKPNEALTRVDAVIILNKLTDRKALYGVKESTFSDINKWHPAFRAIEAAARSYYYTIDKDGRSWIVE